MKTVVKTTALIALLTLVAPMASPVFAATPKEPTVKLDASQAAKLENRLHEIKAMDLNSMTRKEKRTLRKEVKSIERQMNGGGVYVSVGALIIIILLLILIF